MMFPGNYGIIDMGMVPSIIDVWAYDFDREFCFSSSSRRKGSKAK